MTNTVEQVNNVETFYHFSFPIELSNDSKKNEKVISDVQIAKQGTFNYPGWIEDRVITFSEDVFDTMISNFNENVWGSELSLGLPFDAEHLEYLGALGWFTKLYKKPCVDGKNGLFATVEWTKLGAEMIREGRFKYTSISYYTKYKHPESLKEYNYVVCGAALTTRPFLTGMEPVSCSKFKKMTSSEKEVIDEFIKMSRKEENLMSKNSKKEIVEASVPEVSNTVSNVESVETKTEETKTEKYDFSQFKEEIKEMVALSVKEAMVNFSKETIKTEISETKDEIPVELSVDENKEVVSIKESVGIEQIDFSNHPDFISMKETLNKVTQENEALMSKNIEATAEKLSRDWFLNENNDNMLFTQDQKENVVTFLSTLMKIDEGVMSVNKFHIDSKTKLSEMFNQIVCSNFRKTSVTEDKTEIGHSTNDTTDFSKKSEEDIISEENDRIVTSFAKENNLSYVEAYNKCYADGKIKRYVG